MPGKQGFILGGAAAAGTGNCNIGHAAPPATGRTRTPAAQTTPGLSLGRRAGSGINRCGRLWPGGNISASGRGQSNAVEYLFQSWLGVAPATVRTAYNGFSGNLSHTPTHSYIHISGISGVCGNV